jgi:hypothetical protein
MQMTSESAIAFGTKDAVDVRLSGLDLARP